MNSRPPISGRRDRLYAEPATGEEGAFCFDERVAEVFQDMISRSVPGYGPILEGVGSWARLYASPGTTCYDLGCSLGATTLSILGGAARPQELRIVAVDSSEAMLERCRENVAAAFPAARVEYLCRDIRDVELEQASLVCLNFTLQFIPLQDRGPLLARVARALTRAGALILSEKLAGDSEEQGELYREAHEAFKLLHGYSELEVARKRSALENVLLPETLDAHRQRLLACGFTSVELWFRCFQFGSILARRP